MAPPNRPKLGVFKFASCDGCQLSLLDCEDELLAVTDRVEIADFREASSAVLEGPYDLSLVEGSVTTPDDLERLSEIRAQSKVLVTIGACATAGGIQSLRNFGDVDEFRRIVYAHPEFISTLATSTPIKDHVPVDFELRGCPIDKGQLIEVLSAFLGGRTPNVPTESVCIECKRRGRCASSSPTAPPASGPSPRPAAGRSAPDSTGGATDASGRRTRRTRSRWSTSSRSSGWTRPRSPGSSGPSTPWRPRSAPPAMPPSGGRRHDRADDRGRLPRPGRGRGRPPGPDRRPAGRGGASSIFEPPRFFEAFLRGRDYTEAPDITARICGICPVAYQMSSCHAMERALGIEVGGQLRELRRLLYCGEWIESHALHIYLLHAPDFLGYPDAIQMARDHPEAVQRGLALKKAGNAIMRLLGGREIHPINVRVGGFYRAPTARSSRRSGAGRREALELAEETVRFVSGPPSPHRGGLRVRGPAAPGSTRSTRADIVSSRGLRIPRRVRRPSRRSRSPTPTRSSPSGRAAAPTSSVRWRATRSTATVSPRAAKPPGRSGSNRSSATRTAASSCGRSRRSTPARRRSASWTATACPRRPWVEPPAIDHPVHGAAATEAPRGMLYHSYDIDPQGLIESARIVAPTSQNQKRIEDDVRHLVQRSLALDDSGVDVRLRADDPQPRPVHLVRDALPDPRPRSGVIVPHVLLSAARPRGRDPPPP
jgi:sulfhydrogenase subunit alpha